jgi:hypothetical protein
VAPGSACWEGGRDRLGGARDPARRAGVRLCEITFLSDDGTEQWARLTPDVATRCLEEAAPVRSFPSYRGQRNFPGLWWSATSGAHVGFESWLERDHAMLLDFDPAVVGFAAQPFRMTWSQLGRPRSHVPDFFARLVDGTGVVIDCRAAERIGERDAETFAVTAAACAGVGWWYRLVDSADEVLVANVAWLAGYRHPRHHRPDLAEALAGVFARPTPLLAGAEAVGDPIGVLPVLYHLAWRGELRLDLAVGLNEDSVVSVPRA